MPRRSITLALGLFGILYGTSAQAQWGYGWGGWGGATTFQGDVARGMGVFEYGAGLYNLNTAQAASINADTWMRWNNYWYLSQQEATKRYYEYKYKNIQRNKTQYNEIMRRIRETPSAKDVEDGDALNAALEQLSDPRIHASSLRTASTPIGAEMIENIPFRNNSEAVTIMLSDLKEATKWPAVLDTERFALDKHVFENIVDQARREDEVGEISPNTLARAKALVEDLRLKLATQPLADSADNLRAIKFVKSVSGLIQLIGKNEPREALNELRKVKTTTVGHLIVFMQAFNLKFGPAKTPKERVVYRELYSMLDQTRSKILGAAKLDEPVAAGGPEHVNEVFSALEPDGKTKKATPEPPKPQQ